MNHRRATISSCRNRQRHHHYRHTVNHHRHSSTPPPPHGHPRFSDLNTLIFQYEDPEFSDLKTPNFPIRKPSIFRSENLHHCLGTLTLDKRYDEVGKP
ncbi:unnamed protein product [Lactuca virosa]|uniref:Uncharacterized protein n=1 Tax=Lactuca virosa TaxID=75947 RepID=A0AAU9PEJ2_9ASTR|nr:unnamed protein product [Lactuca virosa]